MTTPSQIDYQPKATLIPQAEISVEAPINLNFHVTAWSEPKHTLTSHIGTEPLENGALITDHVVSFPPRLSLKGYVSDVIDGAHTPEVTWEIVRQLHDREALMNVLTEWGYYKDMVMRLAETKQTGRGMEFLMEFQHIVRVGLDIIKIFNPVKPEADPERIVYVIVSAKDFKPLGFDKNAQGLDDEGDADGAKTGAVITIGNEDVLEILKKHKDYKHLFEK